MTRSLNWGALDRWRAEIRAGVGGQRAGAPSTWDFTDPVFLAAVLEAGARDADRQGLPSHVRLLRARYEAILDEAIARAELAA